MKGKSFLLYLISLLILFMLPQDASADIFDELADRGEVVGSGLRGVGFIIAGFALIAFSIAAIFNKISWKTLSYIMISTAVLSAMTLVIDTMRGGDASWIGDVPSQSGSGNAEGSYGEIERIRVRK